MQGEHGGSVSGPPPRVGCEKGEHGVSARCGGALPELGAWVQPSMPSAPQPSLPAVLQACISDVDDAVSRCRSIGYPCMLKASGGGGGKGIRKVCAHGVLS